MKFDWSRNVNRSKVSGSIAEIFCSLFFLLLAFFFLPFLALLPFCALSDIVLAAVVAPIVIRPDYGRLWLLFFFIKKKKTFLFVFQRKKCVKNVTIISNFKTFKFNFVKFRWRVASFLADWDLQSRQRLGCRWHLNFWKKKKKIQVIFGSSL